MTAEQTMGLSLALLVMCLGLAGSMHKIPRLFVAYATKGCPGCFECSTDGHSSGRSQAAQFVSNGLSRRTQIATPAPIIATIGLIWRHFAQPAGGFRLEFALTHRVAPLSCRPGLFLWRS